MTDFNTYIERKNTHSMKWDNLQAVYGTDDLLPMWVADMDFKAPKEVNEALIRRAEHGIYGYTFIDDSIKDNVTAWVSKRHKWQIDNDRLIFSPGVITSINAAIETLTEAGDEILIQTPVYTPFFNLINNSGRKLIENELIYNGRYYEIDFNDLEKKFKQGVKVFIFCSPHNPVGRVWTKSELEKIAELAIKYEVFVLSDEIHADIVFKGFTHIPLASLSKEISERTITFMSPTKTFNLAGLQASYAIVENKTIRRKLITILSQQGLSMLNTMGVTALNAAYKYGESWLEELLDVLIENKAYVINTIEEKTNGRLKVLDSEATYLLWIDCKQLNFSATELESFMIQQAKVGLNAGAIYGKAGEQFMRINIATPLSLIEEGVNRIVTAVNKLAD